DTDTVEFLNDQVTWGNAYAFAWSPGAWYWFELEERAGTLYGKVWADGTPEPAVWMFEQDGWADRPGAPALTGGSDDGAIASFDDVTVAAAGGNTAPTADPSTVTLSDSGRGAV